MIFQLLNGFKFEFTANSLDEFYLDPTRRIIDRGIKQMGFKSGLAALIECRRETDVGDGMVDLSVVKSGSGNVNAEGGDSAFGCGKLIKRGESKLSAVASALGNVAGDRIASAEHSLYRLDVAILESRSDSA